jgi:hypothetical protein
MKSVIIAVLRQGRSGATRGVLCAAILSMAMPVGAQMQTPLHVGAIKPISNELGVVLRGNASANPATCDRVELLWASNSVSYPPDFDGSPAPDNPSVAGGASWIGSLTSPALLNPGIFGMSIGGANRPPSGSRLFVRVYNAPTREAASFYTDSQIMTVVGNTVLLAEIAATTNAMDPRDNDSDGLNNSWEKSLGSNPNDGDTDGDGMSDRDEFRAGTGLTDPDSFLVVADVRRDGDNGLQIEWAAVAGKTYAVEYSTNNLPAQASYQEFSGHVTADGSSDRACKLIPDGQIPSRMQIRVRLVEP